MTAPASTLDHSVQRALRLLAEECARLGGQIAQDYFGSDYDVRLKEDRSEVSEADEAAQAAIVELIRQRRPDDAFITEESLKWPPGAAPSQPPSGECVTWIIDPIDGTRNFVRHLTAYCCSVAAMHGGLPAAGAVRDPERGRTYSASLAEGWFIDGQPEPPAATQQSSPTGARRKPVVGIPSNPVGPVAAIAHRWLDECVCRNFGSTALHLALVAAGRLDAMLTDNARLWDIAAGWVLVTVSGGVVTRPDGQPLFPLDVATYHGAELPTLAAAGALHPQLVTPQ